jgi:sugar (pentulose or hexulose) kinase
MSAIPVIAIFDIGKTNKKLFLIDEQYKIVWERTARIAETVDEDRYPCEDIKELTLWVFEALREVTEDARFSIGAINFTAYGASFVLLDKNGEPVAPIYNYLKPFPKELQDQFYGRHGGEAEFSNRTASPLLGSLNSGLQLYRIKQERPGLFGTIGCALHLPQYLSFLLTGKYYSDLTSIGCHTGLWDFAGNDYHRWVYQEGIDGKLAPIASSGHVERGVFKKKEYPVGTGLHDSSAALIPYLAGFREPFVLISTGTWCISLNPFNQAPLTREELENDCLCYFTHEGKPIKASRLFAGQEHEVQTAKITAHFGLNGAWNSSIDFDEEVLAYLPNRDREKKNPRSEASLRQSLFAGRDLNTFASPSEAYHQLILDIVKEQYASTQYVMSGRPVKRIFVDGGFSTNSVFMNLLAAAFPDLEVYAASVPQATAIGAALAIHRHWNTRSLPNDIIDLKYYSLTRGPIV